MTQASAITQITQLLARALVLLTAIPIHEFAHGFTANLLGDPTAKNAGRLTLNPFKHFDLTGTLALFLVGVGWAKPVPINSRYFKHPKRDIAIVSFAGPFANLLLAYLSIIIFKVLYFLYGKENFGTRVFLYAVSINIILMIFNLLPIPPNDGFKIIGSFLPQRIYYSLLKYERYGIIILVILIFTGILLGPLDAMQNAVISVLDTLTGYVNIIMRIILRQ